MAIVKCELVESDDMMWRNGMEPLNIMFHYVSLNMGPAKAWTKSRMVSLSGDPLLGTDLATLRGKGGKIAEEKKWRPMPDGRIYVQYAYNQKMVPQIKSPCIFDLIISDSLRQNACCKNIKVSRFVVGEQ